MKSFFTLLLMSVSFCASSQVLCGTVDENNVLTLTAPPGNVITSIQFASYGTPNGSCGSFTIGGCHAANSMSIATSTFVGFNSASLSASNSVFGDPCGGTFKRLYIQATYAATAPLTLVSFSAKKIDQEKVRLSWSSENEVNTSHFVIEKSSNGVFFEAMDSVRSLGSGRGNYSFTFEIERNVSIYYFRLKMVDIDGKFQYSPIVRVNNKQSGNDLIVFTNPSAITATIISNKQQKAILVNAAGQVIRQVALLAGSQSIDISALSLGIYFIKTQEGVWKFVK